MKTVKIFYAGIPTKNNNAEKVDVLRFFHMERKVPKLKYLSIVHATLL